MSDPLQSQSHHEYFCPLLEGEQGVKVERSGAGGGPDEDFATGRPAVTGDCLLPGVTGRIDTPAGEKIRK